MWTLFFVTSLSLCFYQILTLLISYYQYGVTVSIAKIEESPTIFPAVTICNINPFNEERVLKYIHQKEQELNYSIFNEDQIDKTDQIIRFIYEYGLTIDEIISLSNSLENETLLSCEFNSANCSASESFSVTFNEKGFCYTFNLGNESTKPEKSSFTGRNSGLTLELVLCKYY